MLFKASLYGGIVCCSCWVATVSAQEVPSKEQAALVDGLLELLNEPARGKSQPDASSPASPASSSGSDTLAPSATHPLQTVRNNMFTAAGYLSKGFVNQQTQQLQSDIVVSLDELIEQLQQANPPEQSRRQQEQHQQQQSTSAKQQQQTENKSATEPQGQGAAPNDPNQEEAQPDAGGEDQSPATPGQQGKGANPTVDLVDPKTLQQDVWGQLPEQIRKQMQSRMVERFLPSYRPQIEAYFQALIEGEK